MNIKRWIGSKSNLPWYQYFWALLPVGIVVVGGALGGVLGASAATINVKLMNRRWSAPSKYLVTGLVSLSTVGIYFLVAKLILISGLIPMTARDIDRELMKSPVYVALKKADGKAYGKLRDDVVDAVNHGHSRQDIRRVARLEMTSALRKYLPLASDQAVLDATRIILLEIDQIGAKDADACAAFLLPTSGAAVDTKKFITPEVEKAGEASTVAAIETAAAAPQQIPQREQVQPYLREVVRRLTAQFGTAAVTAFAKPATLDHAQFCKMTSAFYQQVLSLPRNQSVLILRFIFSQHHAV